MTEKEKLIRSLCINKIYTYLRVFSFSSTIERTPGNILKLCILDNKHMKKLLTLILITAFASSVANAAENKSEGQNRRGGPEQMVRMKEYLGLSDEQAEQIMEIRQNGGGRQEIQAIFTEEQRQLIHERRSQGKGQGRNQTGNRANRQGGRDRSHQATEPSEDQENTEPTSENG